MKRFPSFAFAAFAAAALAPLPAFGATATVVPTTSYDGAYTVSWTNMTAITSAVLATSANGGAWTTEPVTGSTSRSFTGRPIGSYSHRVDFYRYDAETRKTWLIGSTNVVTVVVRAPGMPGAIAGPSSSMTGAYALTWGASEGAVSSYELTENGTFVYGGTSLSASITGRGLGTFAYRARACSSVGCSPYTAEMTVSVIPPPVPGPISGPASSTTGSYVLSWGASAGPVSKYELTENGVLIYAGAVLSATVGGRGDGSFAYQARACSTLGCSAFTAEMIVAVLRPPPTPAPIAAPATNASGRYDVTWTRPSGYVVEGYKLERRVGGAAWTTETLGTVETYTEPAAVDGTYEYRVSAFNSAGTSAPTPIASVVVKLELAGIVPDATVVAPDVPEQGWVGTVPGEPRVDGGAARYRIPIEVPPGRAGMQPEIALEYASNRGNGIAGVGWTLSGLSTIYRCPRTLDHDGANRPVMLDRKDPLCMDGQRLVLVSGTHGNVGSEYRTEIDSFVRITLIDGDDLMRSSRFKVEHGSGRITFLRHVGSQVPQEWRVDHESDAQRNCIRYDYAPFLGRNPTEWEWVLSKIVYTGREGTDGTCVTDEQARVLQFLYTTDRQDARTTYAAGAASLATARLDAILTSVGASSATNVPVRRYQLEYKASGATGRSLLVGVRLCAGSTCNGAALPPTEFTYEEQAARFEPTRFYRNAVQLSDGTLYETFSTDPASGVSLGMAWTAVPADDYDGDGVRDMLYVEDAGSAGSAPVRRLSLSSCGESTLMDGASWWAGNTWVNAAPFPTRRGRDSLDYNHDGRADVIGVDPGGMLAFGTVKCYPTRAPGDRVEWTGNSTSISLSNPLNPSSYAYAHDYDGDGRTDVIYHDGTQAEHAFTVIRNGGKDPSTGRTTWTEVAAAPMSAETAASLSGLRAQFRADFNGDGLEDQFFLNENYPSKSLSARIVFFRRDEGTGWLSWVSKTLEELGGPYWGPYSVRTRWADVNGDGLLDIYDRGTVWLNRGGAPGPGMFERRVAALLDDPLDRARAAFVMDVDGDGRDELMVPKDQIILFCFHDPSTPAEPYPSCRPGAFDDPLNPYADLDRSVFTFRAFRFQENSDGSFRFAEIPLDENARPMAPVRSKLQLEDHGGDGSRDIIYALRNEEPYYDGGYTGYRVDAEMLGPWLSRNLAPAPDLLKGVVNGMGAVAHWGHQPLSRESSDCDPAIAPFYAAHHDAPRAPNYAFFTSSMWAVTSHDVANGLGASTNRSCYRYEDAMLNMAGRGFQGFKKIVSEERLPPAGGETAVGAPAPACGASGCSANNVRTTTEFNQEFPFTNRLRKVRVENAVDGRLLSETTQWWHAEPQAAAEPGHRTWVVYPTATEESKYDPATGSKLATSTSVSEVDPVSGEQRASCVTTNDLASAQIYASWSPLAPGAAPRPISFSREARQLTNDTVAWWLGRVDSREEFFDFAASPLVIDRPQTTISPVAPETCPSPAASATSRTRTVEYAWYPAVDVDPGKNRKLASERLLVGGAEETKTRYEEYDLYGHVTASTVTARDVVDPAGSPQQLTTRHAYGADGYFLETETNPVGHVSTVLSDPATGKPTRVQSVQGGPWTTTDYDALGRVLSVRTDGQQPAHERLLDCRGDVCGEGIVVARQRIQAGAPTTTEYLDRLGRVVAATTESLDSRLVVTGVEFNERGLRTAEYAPRFDDDATSFATRFSGFDVLGRAGRKITERDPAALVDGPAAATLVTDYAYEGYKTRITVTASAGSIRTLEMSRTVDARGKLIETTQRNAGHDILTRYVYDPVGALTHVVDSAGNDLSAEYDDLGRKTRVVDPDRGTWTYGWDGLGRLVLQTDGRGVATRHEYDGIGRLERRSAGTLEETWLYDPIDPLAGTRWGVLGTAENNEGFSRTYRYDGLLRPIEIKTRVPAQDALLPAGARREFTLEHAYDASYGRPKGIRYPGGDAIAFDYGARGHLIGESEPLPGQRRGTQYRLVRSLSPRGRVTDQEFGNCAVEVAAYDRAAGIALDLSALRPSAARAADGACPAALTSVRQVRYQLDPFLNLAMAEKNFTAVQAVETYSYDELHRLTSATRTWTGAGLPTTAQVDAYAYDDLGNILAKSDYGTPYTYDATRPHAVTSVLKNGQLTPTSFSYDDNGNMVEGDGRTVTFDAFDKPVSVTLGDVTTHFAYAPDGSRYRQWTTGPTSPRYGPKTVYYVDKDYELVVWNDGGRTEERSYVGSSVVLYRDSAGTREARYLHLDRLGSVDAVTSSTTDADGVETATELSVDAHGYDPFGEPRAREWTSSGERLHPDGNLSVTTTRGFTGHEHLDNLYLVHMNGRVYDYRLGRFLSVDPIISDPANSQSINPYSYIGNNPLSGTDPTGYMSVGTGCGSFARCDVIMVNPSPATIAMYTPSNFSSGAEKQTAQVAKAIPAEVHNPQQVAQKDDASKAKDDSLDGVLLAAGGARGGGRGSRSGGLRPGPAEEGVLEPAIPRQTRLETEFEQLRREAETLTGKRIDVVGETTPQSVEWMRTVRDNARAEAAQAARTPRTPTDRLVQHTSTSDLVGAAREARTGVPHGGQHLKEVSEAAQGLRIRIEQINNGLTNPNLRSGRRQELEQELSKASKALDAAEQAIQGNYPRHSQ